MALRIEHEASLLTTAVAMAAAGLGIAVVPSTMLQYLPHHGLVARKLTRPVVERHTALIYRLDRSLPPAAQALAKALASP